MLNIDEELREVRKQLNYYRRLETKLVKDLRMCCSHRNVKKIAHAEPVNVRAFLSSGSAPYQTRYHTTIKCEDCGKVLSRG